MPTGRRRRKHECGKGLAWVLAALGAALLAGAVAVPHFDRQDAATDDAAGVISMARAPTPTTRPQEVVAPAARASRPRVRRAEQAGPPLQIDVRTLGISTPVDPIALDAGVLEPPADFHRVGWWQGGADAGAARGTAVVAGHTVHTGGGVFNDLGRLRTGDLVRVTTGKGTLNYRVASVTVYAKASLSRYAHTVFSQTVPGRLALVTCEGWNGHGYDSNVVVLARPTEHSPQGR